MTTPPEEPAAEPSPEPTPEPAAAAPTATVPPVAAPSAAAPPGYAPSPYPNPAFAPVVRAPREPWVNPAKKGQFVALSLVLAFVLLFGGLAVGFAVGHHRAERGINSRFEQGVGRQPGPPGSYPRYFPNGGQPRIGGPNKQRKVPFGPPSPSPTATKSG